MKRLYYLTDTLDSVERIAEALHKEGVSDWNFHVISKDQAGLYRRHIHSANFVQKSDVVRYAERGAMVGFLCSILGSVYVASEQPFGPDMSGMVYFAIFGFVTLFGVWVGGLMGMATENQKIAAYHGEIEAGKHLILIDAKAEEEERVRELMARTYPDAHLLRVGSTLINPFKFARPAV
ncbi:hypothetical protein [Methylococcus geothermalis]|uniref:Transmembrane protein n=1 Tax=Methylococcus geothermalis TaxID=2681310 RepID=A0A858Q8S4_9GAMM|nr:hypothetical protein [Methylococcus geothermalis]QJD30154.1 hypothetical protein GNH96_09350 [Methylococcus geothermalis]